MTHSILTVKSGNVIRYSNTELSFISVVVSNPTEVDSKSHKISLYDIFAGAADALIDKASPQQVWFHTDHTNIPKGGLTIHEIWPDLESFKADYPEYLI